MAEVRPLVNRFQRIDTNAAVTASGFWRRQAFSPSLSPRRFPGMGPHPFRPRGDETHGVFPLESDDRAGERIVGRAGGVGRPVAEARADSAAAPGSEAGRSRGRSRLQRPRFPPSPRPIRCRCPIRCRLPPSHPRLQQLRLDLPALPLPAAIATPSVAPTVPQTPSKTVELPALPLRAENLDDAPKPVILVTPGQKVTAPNYNPAPAPSAPTASYRGRRCSTHAADRRARPRASGKADGAAYFESANWPSALVS